MLDLPGGTPHFNETLETTLEREILEETGLKISRSRQLITLLAIFQQKHDVLRHMGVIYAVNITSDDNLKTSPDGEDSGGCVWQSIDQINASSCTPFVVQLKEQGLMVSE